MPHEAFEVRLNGEPRLVSQTMTLADFLDQCGVSVASMAVAVNRAFVPRHQYDLLKIQPHDDIEVLRPMAGG